jgi:hypothetical protein
LIKVGPNSRSWSPARKSRRTVRGSDGTITRESNDYEDIQADKCDKPVIATPELTDPLQHKLGYKGMLF